MFAKNSKAYSVYLLFRFVCSLAVSMSTVLSIVYHLEVVQLDAFQLVLVGTVQETSCFLFEMPTGVVADLYSRRRSVLIGMFLYGLGFLMEGALPWFAPVLLAQVVWGCGDTFITGALEAWIASEEEDKPIDKVFLRGSQMGQIGGVLGVVLGTLLGNINLQMPVILGGSLCLLLGLVMVRIMPETNFSPAIEERQGLLKDFVCLFKLNLGFVKGAPVLLALLAITLCGGLASEGFDRLSTAHFLDDTVIPVIGPLNSVTWFGVISLIGNGLGILASQLLIARMEKKGTVSRTSVVMSTSAGYILCLVLFAVGRSFWFMLLVFLLTHCSRNAFDGSSLAILLSLTLLRSALTFRKLLFRFFSTDLNRRKRHLFGFLFHGCVSQAQQSKTARDLAVSSSVTVRPSTSLTLPEATALTARG